MSGTIAYFTKSVICPDCGTENEVLIITEYDVHEGENFTDVAGEQECADCPYKFTTEDVSE